MQKGARSNPFTRSSSPNCLLNKVTRNGKRNPTCIGFALVPSSRTSDLHYNSLSFLPYHLPLTKTNIMTDYKFAIKATSTRETKITGCHVLSRHF